MSAIKTFALGAIEFVNKHKLFGVAVIAAVCLCGYASYDNHVEVNSFGERFDKLENRIDTLEIRMGNLESKMDLLIEINTKLLAK